MRHRQRPIAHHLADDSRPVADWAEGVQRLVPALYDHDPDLSRQIDVVVQRLTSSAENLDCIGTDDPAAPPAGSPTRDVLAYLFHRRPEDGVEFNRVVSRADQVLGRQRILALLSIPEAPRGH